MTEKAQSDALDKALARLRASLSLLESTIARRLENELSLADLEEELAIMQDDRSRLALELDAQLSKANALEKAREDVLRRLDLASGEIGAVLGAASNGGS
jgi:hypothetical protein